MSISPSCKSRNRRRITAGVPLLWCLATKSAISRRRASSLSANIQPSASPMLFSHASQGSHFSSQTAASWARMISRQSTAESSSAVISASMCCSGVLPFGMMPISDGLPCSDGSDANKFPGGAGDVGIRSDEADFFHARRIECADDFRQGQLARQTGVGGNDGIQLFALGSGHQSFVRAALVGGFVFDGDVFRPARRHFDGITQRAAFFVGEVGGDFVQQIAGRDALPVVAFDVDAHRSGHGAEGVGVGHTFDIEGVGAVGGIGAGHGEFFGMHLDAAAELGVGLFDFGHGRTGGGVGFLYGFAGQAARGADMVEVRTGSEGEEGGAAGVVDALAQQHFGIGLLLQIGGERLAFQFEGSGDGGAGGCGHQRNQALFFARENVFKRNGFDHIGRGQAGQVDFLAHDGSHIDDEGFGTAVQLAFHGDAYAAAAVGKRGDGGGCDGETRLPRGQRHHGGGGAAQQGDFVQRHIDQQRQQAAVFFALHASTDAGEEDVAHGLGEVLAQGQQAAGGGVHHLTGSPVLPPPGVTPLWVWASRTTPLLESVPPLWRILPLMVVLPPRPLLPAMPA
nr:MAG TPA: hypothetical protein [Caudoviricetes sp.]